MGILNSIKGQFIDVIEYTDENSDVIVKKYIRVKDDDEIKWGAKLIVRESQVAVFFKGGKFVDVLEPGTHTLSTENLPIISKVLAVPYALNSPIKADIFFVSTKQFINKNWGTKNPIIIRDREFDIVRIRAFGNYAFRVINAQKFMTEVFGTQRKGTTKEIVDYLTSLLVETFSIVISNLNIPIIELATKYREIGNEVQNKINEKSREIGIEFCNIVIENISLPEEVEKIIDTKTSVGVVKNDFDNYSKFETIQAMRDAARQENGMAGIGASIAIGSEIAKNVKNDKEDDITKIKCPNCNSLNVNKSKFCSNCGAELKVSKFCNKCGTKYNVGDKFCSNCGNNIQNN